MFFIKFQFQNAAKPFVYAGLCTFDFKKWGNSKPPWHYYLLANLEYVCNIVGVLFLYEKGGITI